MTRKNNNFKIVPPCGPEKLREWLSSHKVPDEELAANLGVSIYAIRKYKGGHRVPRGDHGLILRKMEKITGIPLGDWFVNLV